MSCHYVVTASVKQCLPFDLLPVQVQVYSAERSWATGREVLWLPLFSAKSNTVQELRWDLQTL